LKQVGLVGYIAMLVGNVCVHCSDAGWSSEMTVYKSYL